MNNPKEEAASDEAVTRNGKGPGKQGGRRDNKKRQRSRSPVDRSKGGSDAASKASKRVYVANVPFDVKWNELKDLFRDKIGNVVYCQLFEDEQGRSRGCGLVEFTDAASAKKAIEILHRYEYRNREMVVKEDLDCERDRYGRLITGKGGGDEGGRRDPGYDRHPGEVMHPPASHSAPPGTWNTYGLSPQFLESLGVQGPLNNRIFVANLDYKVGEKKLEEIFKLAGKTLRVRLYTDSTGQSKGHGTVEFEHPVEAVQAISMFNNQKLYGRPMSIRMDKYETEEIPEELPSKLPSGLEGIGKGLGIGGQPLNVSKSLLGSQGPGMTPVVPSTPMAAAALGSLSQMQSMPGVHSTMNPLSQQPNASSLGMSLASLDQRAASNMNPSLGGNGLMSYGSLATSPASGVRVNPSLGLGSAVQSSVYEREFRDARNTGVPVTVADTVLVRNLPPSLSWQSLRDRFSEVGEVRYAELKGVGVAVVRFVTERDAQRAVDLMNGSRFEGRIIDVTPYF